jgi:hypothetical protein
MPIRYYISPELNIILYIGEEVMTSSEYFEAAAFASRDEHRRWGMVTIIDILSAEADFELQDIHGVISFANNLHQQGLEPEQIIVLTLSTGIYLASETIKMLPSEVPIKLDVVSTLDDLISSLGFSVRKQEFIQFYNESKFEKRKNHFKSHAPNKAPFGGAS